MRRYLVSIVGLLVILTIFRHYDCSESTDVQSATDSEQSPTPTESSKTPITDGSATPVIMDSSTDKMESTTVKPAAQDEKTTRPVPAVKSTTNSPKTASGGPTVIKQPTPKPKQPVGETKKCGDEDCEVVLFEGRAIKPSEYNHSEFLQYNITDLIKVYGIEFNDRVDLWYGEINDTSGMFYKNTIEHSGFLSFLYDVIHEKKFPYLYVVNRKRKMGDAKFITKVKAAVALAKQYEINKEAIEQLVGPEKSKISETPTTTPPVKPIDQPPPAKTEEPVIKEDVPHKKPQKKLHVMDALGHGHLHGHGHHHDHHHGDHDHSLPPATPSVAETASVEPVKTPEDTELNSGEKKDVDDQTVTDDGAKNETDFEIPLQPTENIQAKDVEVPSDVGAILPNEIDVKSVDEKIAAATITLEKDSEKKIEQQPASENNNGQKSPPDSELNREPSVNTSTQPPTENKEADIPTATEESTEEQPADASANLEKGPEKSEEPAAALLKEEIKEPTDSVPTTASPSIPFDQIIPVAETMDMPNETPRVAEKTAEIRDEFGVDYCIKGDCDQGAAAGKDIGNVDGQQQSQHTEEHHHVHDHKHDDDHHGHSHDHHDHGHSHSHGHSHGPPASKWTDYLIGFWRRSVTIAHWAKQSVKPIVAGFRFILGRLRRALPKELGNAITERDIFLFVMAVSMFVLHLVGRIFAKRTRESLILKLSEHSELYEKYTVLKLENEKLRAGGAVPASASNSGNTAQITHQLQEKYEKLIMEERSKSDAVINELKNDNEHLRQAHDLLDSELAELRRQLSKHGHADKELRQHQREYDDLKGRHDSLNAQLIEYRTNFEREREKVDDFERRLAEEHARCISKERYGEQLKEEMNAVQTMLNESREEIRRLNEDMAVKSEELGSLKELVTSLRTMRLDVEERATKPKRDYDDDAGKKSSESNGDWDLGEGLDEEDGHRTHQQHQAALAIDLESKLAELTDAAKLRTKIKELEVEREQMKKVLGEEYEHRRKLEQQHAEMKTDYDAMKQRQKDAEQQAVQAQTRLQILEEFFQSKQTELQKQLGHQQVLSQQRSELVASSEERIKRYQDEKTQAEKIAEDLRREMKEVEKENSKLRQESDRQRHEAWLASRRNERELEALRLEAAALRARVADANATTGARSFVSEQRSPAGSTGGGLPTGDDNNSSEAELAAIAVTRESPYLSGTGKMNKSATFPTQPPPGEPPYLPFMPSYPPPPMPPMHMPPPPMDYPPPHRSGHVSPLYGPPYGMPPPMDMYDDYRRSGPSPPTGEFRRNARSTGSGGGQAKRNKSKTRSPPRSPSPPPDDFRRSGRRSQGAEGARRSKSKNRSPPRIPSPSFFRKY